MSTLKLCLLSTFACLTLLAYQAHAEDSLLTGSPVYQAVGDSITYGVGDGTHPGETVSTVPVTDGSKGYPNRLRQLLGISVLNQGFPGEELALGGVARIPAVVAQSKGTIVGLFEGSNDARQGTSSEEYRRALQRSVNVIRLFGKEPFLVTLPRPCCDRAFFAGGVEALSNVVRAVAAANDIRVADVELAWKTTCENADACELYNIPEGLHPNSRGYDVIAQVISAALLGVDIFSGGGASDLASALGVEESEIIVKPFEG